MSKEKKDILERAQRLDDIKKNLERPKESPTQTKAPEVKPTVESNQQPQQQRNQRTQRVKKRAPAVPSEDMILISSGFFIMGESERKVFVDDFYIDKYPVTNEQYREFCLAKGKPREFQPRTPFGLRAYRWKNFEYPKGQDSYPVWGINWYAAMAYTEWAGKRLPTEAEWEKAARGGLEDKYYPWGDEIDANKANYKRAGKSHPDFVGMYPPNGYGLYDMAGNVWEWCLDEWHKQPVAPSHSNPTQAARRIMGIAADFKNIKTSRVVRGGSFFTRHKFMILYSRSNRLGVLPQAHRFGYATGIGFRCVKSLTS